jgi:hypothetical protein
MQGVRGSNPLSSTARIGSPKGAARRWAAHSASGSGNCALRLDVSGEH